MSTSALPSGPLGPVVERMVHIARVLTASIAPHVPEGEDVAPHAILTGMFIGLTLYADNEALSTRLRAWSIATGKGEYSELARYIATGENATEKGQEA